MTKIIGLTGGIGSGKTTVANLFSAHGIPVYITDTEARNLMQSEIIISQIEKIFGNSVFKNGILLRDKLSEIVFNNVDKLKQLNEIVHPAVKKHFNDWVKEHKNSQYVIYESAILFESGSYKECDLTITVVVPLEIRVQRVIERDNTTKEKVLERVKNQWNDEQKSSKSDFILENISLEAVKLEIVKILNFLGIKQIKS
jgi:dephospho-CoA kinase